jgi:alpha,alpha-trehalose phosphorylase
MLRATQPDAYNVLVHKTVLSLPRRMLARAAENMYVPYDEKRKIIPQDDNFLDREPWDFQNTRPNVIRYCCLHPLNIYRKQVIKQADVVLAMSCWRCFFTRGEEAQLRLLRSLTTGDSRCRRVEAIIAAQIGDMEKAFRYGMAALLGSGRRRWKREGRLPYCLDGGTWMMLTYGFGMRDNDGTLSFWPRRAPRKRHTSVS